MKLGSGSCSSCGGMSIKSGGGARNLPACVTSTKGLNVAGSSNALISARVILEGDYEAIGEGASFESPVPGVLFTGLLLFGLIRNQTILLGQPDDRRRSGRV